MSDDTELNFADRLVITSFPISVEFEVHEANKQYYSGLMCIGSWRAGSFPVNMTKANIRKLIASGDARIKRDDYPTRYGPRSEVSFPQFEEA